MRKKLQKKPTPKKSSNGSQGKETRRMILDAATKVFAMHPYNAASIRMIATQGDFYHGLHFPNKAEIFKTVVEEACHSLFHANKKWLLEVSTLSLEKGLSLYLDRIIAFSQDQPEAFRIVIQNLSHDDLATLPGGHLLVGFLANTRNDFEKTFKGLFPGTDTGMLLDSLNALIIHYLGAGSMAANVAGLEPQSDEYFQWIKETMMFIFLPVLKSMRTKKSRSV